LDQNNLVGKIPAEIGSLVDLSELYLRANKIYGVIPDEMGNLKNLRKLNLGQNQLNSNPSRLTN